MSDKPKVSEDKWEAALARMLEARAAVLKHANGSRGIGGRLDCPVCKTGSLQYSIARSNGHIHAACSTPACVRWME